MGFRKHSELGGNLVIGIYKPYREYKTASTGVFVMKLGTIQLLETDRVSVKQMWKFPSPVAHEVKLLFDAFRDYSRQKVGLGLLTIPGMRPSEAAIIKKPRFCLSSDGHIQEFTHEAYKPRLYVGKIARHYKYKEVKKPIYAWSPWLSDQIIGYFKTSPEYEGCKAFPWTTGDVFIKMFQKLRKAYIAGKLGPDYAFLLEKNDYPLLNNPPIQHRVNPYSLRRFAITFHYWITFNKNLPLVSSIWGHSDPKTTFNHYILPYQAIGLTEQMIKQKITMDEFIHLQGKKQMRIIDFNPDWQHRLLPAGQARLSDF